jgi:hypothetical protein
MSHVIIGSRTSGRDMKFLTRFKFHSTILASAVILLISSNTANGTQVLKTVVATFSPDGTLISSFDAGRIGQQFISSIELERQGNIWVGRMDVQHGNFPSPNDKVVQYTAAGTELLTVKGPMAEPHAVAFDSMGNIFIAGDLEASEDSVIFKYLPSGNFVTSFDTPGSSPPDKWYDLVITTDDRIFAGGVLLNLD